MFSTHKPSADPTPAPGDRTPRRLAAGHAAMGRTAAVRRARGGSAGAVEALEDRLCLGGLVADGAPGGLVDAPAVGGFDDDHGHGHGPGDVPPWFDADSTADVTVRYDFRDLGGHANAVTDAQRAVVEQVFQTWADASGGRVNFVRDTAADSSAILTVGTGDLAAVGRESGAWGDLGAAGTRVLSGEHGDGEGGPALAGVIWLDHAERWSTENGSGTTVDFFTVFAHETGHALGLDHAAGLMAGDYTGPRGEDAVADALSNAVYLPLLSAAENGGGVTATSTHAIQGALQQAAQLTEQEVQDTLSFASVVSASEDAIIAIVDRAGNILGVRVEQDVLDTFAGRPDELVFAIDGAVAKARTAAFFANGDPTNGASGTFAPLTSRLVRFISQSTVTQREVEGNPNITDPNSTVRGPGFVAPIGVGGNFPPEITNTPQVDLFGIEHTNRDSIVHPGVDAIKGTADDVLLRNRPDPGQDGVFGTDDDRLAGRFNVDPAFVPPGQEIFAPESYGFETGLLPGAQSRGIATLPGGVPIYRDTDGDGDGDTLIGGIGVFFPGPDGFATFEQNFIPGVNQTEFERNNAPKVLEAEFIAVAAAGGSRTAAAFIDDERLRVDGSANVPAHPVGDLDIPFGRLDLVGIQLQAIGPTAGACGLEELLDFAERNPDLRDIVNGVEITPAQAAARLSGIDVPVNAGADGLPNTGDEGLYENGEAVPFGTASVVNGELVLNDYLVEPHASTVDPDLTEDVVRQIITQAFRAASEVRAAVRLQGDPSDNGSPGARTRMVFAVTDTSGEVLGLFRMQDATIFSIDVAVAKARNTAYYADPVDLQEIDRVEDQPRGVAYTNRTFRFLSEPRYPEGPDGSPPGPFSILNNPSVDVRTAENVGAPAAASTFTSVLGNDAFNPNTNFRDPGDPSVIAANGPSPVANQNGIVFFPGSVPLYSQNGSNLIGGFGVSGDGVDQDDVVTFLGSRGFQANGTTVPRADHTLVRGVRLPYVKFLRNPFG